MKSSTSNTHTECMFFLVVMVLLFSTGDVFAITTQELQAPMVNLKKEVFDWMFIVKLGAAAVGAIFGLIKQSLTPFGVGLGVTAGITLFSTVLDTSAQAALI